DRPILRPKPPNAARNERRIGARHQPAPATNLRPQPPKAAGNERRIGARHQPASATAEHRTKRTPDRGAGGSEGAGGVPGDHASEWVTGSSPIHSRRVFLSLICWMKM